MNYPGSPLLALPGLYQTGDNMARKGKSEKEATRQDQQGSGKSIKDVDLMGDVATIIGTAIGVVGGAAGFVGSKVVEAISGESGDEPAAKKAGARKGTAKNTSSKKIAGTDSATKKASGKKAAVKKTGSGKKAERSGMKTATRKK